MKSFFSILAVMALVLLFAGAANAQNGAFAPYVDAGISLSGTGTITSTSNPNFIVGGGIESSTKHFLLDANGQFQSGNINVFGSGNGYTGSFTGSAYYKMGGLLLGGGAFASNQIASGTSASQIFNSFSANYRQVRPFVGAGYQFKYDRLLVNYVLPGIDQIQAAGFTFNGVHSQRAVVSNEIFLGTSGLRKHLRLTQTITADSSNTNLAGFATQAGLRGSTVTAGAGLKFVF